MKYAFMAFANHYILFILALSQHFWNWVCVLTGAKVYLAHHFLIICHIYFFIVQFTILKGHLPRHHPPLPPSLLMFLTQLPLQLSVS